MRGDFYLFFSLSLSWYGDGGVDLFVCLFIGFGGKCVVKKKIYHTLLDVHVSGIHQFAYPATRDLHIFGYNRYTCLYPPFKCFFFYFFTSFLHKRFVF